MTTEITHGIRVSVEPFYKGIQPIHSEFHYVFSYKVIIENFSGSTVQLLDRAWYIFDAGSVRKEVKGEGVVGEKPIIPPGHAHEYTSWCPIRSPFGKMHGYFNMARKQDQRKLTVRIPEFELVAPFKLN